MDKGIDVSALTAKVRTYRQLINFIRQNWIAIALNIALAIICAWSIKYGLSRPFNLAIFSFTVTLSVMAIFCPIVGTNKCSKRIENAAISVVTVTGAIAGAIAFSQTYRFITREDFILSILGFICGGILSFFCGALLANSTGYIANSLWRYHRKYCLPIILFVITFTVLFASSFQNVDARSWKFDRETGKLVERTVFIWPGSTLEREYFVVERKPQKEISVWIWFPAVKDSGWSYERKGYSFREKVVLTFNFKNYRAYKMIHGIKFPEIPLYALSRAQAPGYIMSGVLSYIGLALEDVEITKVDGLE